MAEEPMGNPPTERVVQTREKFKLAVVVQVGSPQPSVR